MAPSTATNWTSTEPAPARAPVLIYAAAYESLHYPPDCPFKPERVPLTRQRLAALGLLGREIAPASAPRAALEAFHTPRYLAELDRAVAGDLSVTGWHLGLGTPDTPVFPDLLACGQWAAGAQLTAADLLLTGAADIVFSPFGGFHHARAEQAAGFCYINDVVLACLRLTAAGRRVLFLDLDVHHGDGVQDAFYDRADVLTISLHESGATLFPWGGSETEIGRGPGRGYNVNIPLPAGTYDDAYWRAFHAIVPPLTDAYHPDVLVVELGMDTLAGDPLAHLRLTNNVFVHILDWLRDRRVPLLVTGGGGYHVENTVRGWALAWQTLCGAHDEHDPAAGLGGVLLASTEWAGGLQDRALPVTTAQRQAIEPAIDRTIATVQHQIFPCHQLQPEVCPPWPP